MDNRELVLNTIDLHNKESISFLNSRKDLEKELAKIKSNQSERVKPKLDNLVLDFNKDYNKFNISIPAFCQNDY